MRLVKIHLKSTCAPVPTPASDCKRAHTHGLHVFRSTGKLQRLPKTALRPSSAHPSLGNHVTSSLLAEAAAARVTAAPADQRLGRRVLASLVRIG